ETEIDAQLAAMMNDVVQDEGPECGDARHREDFLIAAPQCPHRHQFRVGFIHRRASLSGRVVEALENIGTRRELGYARWRGREIEERLAEDAAAPRRDVAEMRREAAKRHRFHVRLPG